MGAFGGHPGGAGSLASSALWDQLKAEKMKKGNGIWPQFPTLLINVLIILLASNSVNGANHYCVSQLRGVNRQRSE